MGTQNEAALVFAEIEEFLILKDGTIRFPVTLPNGDLSMHTIQPRQLQDSDLLGSVISSKLTPNIGGFLESWFIALRLIGVKEVKVDIALDDSDY